MVYSSKFVMCVLVDGKPVKEAHDGTVAIPFGSHYSLRFKNKHDRRAVVKFTIDKEDACGPGYIIDPGKSITIHRYHSEPVQFKFVDLDNPEAVAEGKNGPNDGTKGVIEARFYLEKKIEKPPVVIQPVVIPRPSPWPTYPTWPHKPWHYETPGPYEYRPTSVRPTVTYEGGSNVMPSMNMSANSGSVCRSPSKLLQDGCTVPGEHSDQTFSSSYIDMEGDYTTLKIVLKGYVEEKAPAQQNSHCTSCGAKKARKSDRFCGQCGTKL